MRLKVWEPFRSFRPFYGDMERWFDDAPGGSEERTWRPNVDVYETEGSYVLKADLPGINKEDIKIDVNDNTLTFKGEKKFEEKTEKDNYVRVERSYGSFTRSFTLSDNVDPENYLSILEEKVEDWSYLKFPYYKKLGYPGGMYRVGPLGRLNVADGCSTPLANKEFAIFKQLGKNGVLQETLYFHYARLIEMLNCAEEIKVLCNDKDICGKDIWVKANPSGGSTFTFTLPKASTGPAD